MRLEVLIQRGNEERIAQVARENDPPKPPLLRGASESGTEISLSEQTDPPKPPLPRGASES